MKELFGTNEEFSKVAAKIVRRSARVLTARQFRRNKRRLESMIERAWARRCRSSCGVNPIVRIEVVQ